jgi:hypothetical protein
LPAAAGRQALAPLPSQGTLLQHVRQQRLQQELAAVASAEQLMDELFALDQGRQAEQQQPQPQVGALEQQAQRPEVAAVASAGAVAQQGQGAAAAGRSVPTADELMDELLLLEQQQQQISCQPPPPPPPPPQQQHKPGSKRQRHGQGSGAAMVLDAQPAGAATNATAAAGTGLDSLPPTQPAATGGEEAPAAGIAGAGAGQPAAAHTVPLASCFVPHKRVVAFVWAVVRCTVPEALLGDPRNRRALRNALRRET